MNSMGADSFEDMGSDKQEKSSDGLDGGCVASLRSKSGGINM